MRAAGISASSQAVLGGQLLQLRNRARLLQGEFGGGHAPQIAQVRAASQGLTQIVRNRAHVRASGTVRPQPGFGTPHFQQRQIMDVHGRGRQIHGHLPAG
jgi:hypothetical protein